MVCILLGETAKSKKESEKPEKQPDIDESELLVSLEMRYIYSYVPMYIVYLADKTLANYS